MRTSMQWMVMLAGCLLGGCSQTSVEGPTTSADKPAVNGAQYLLAAEPAGAVGVMALRESASDKQPVVVLGRIGGGQESWVEGRAAFVLVDAAVPPTCDAACGDGCACCEDESKAATTLVKFVDPQGRTLAVDSRELLGVAAGQLVAVRGVVKKDTASELSVIADGIYIRR